MAFPGGSFGDAIEEARSVGNGILNSLGLLNDNVARLHQQVALGNAPKKAQSRFEIRGEANIATNPQLIKVADVPQGTGLLLLSAAFTYGAASIFQPILYVGDGSKFSQVLFTVGPTGANAFGVCNPSMHSFIPGGAEITLGSFGLVPGQTLGYSLLGVKTTPIDSPTEAVLGDTVI